VTPEARPGAVPLSPVPLAPDAPPPAAPPAPGYGGGPDWAACVADIHWGWYAETGPVFPLGATLENHLDAGWTLQVGVRESMGVTNGFIFGELAGEYWTFDTKGVTQKTSVDVILPDTVRHINFFNQTALNDLEQFGVHGAVGWTTFPGALNASAGDSGGDRRVFLTGRLGFRGGVNNAYFTQAATAAGVALLHTYEMQHGNPTLDPGRVRILDPVKSNELYIGPFLTLGMGVTWQDACLGGVRLGNVSLSAEVELAYDATDLGEYLHEADLLMISPRITLGFRY
jgi:hypothetical protein